MQCLVQGEKKDTPPLVPLPYLFTAALTLLCPLHPLLHAALSLVTKFGQKPFIINNGRPQPHANHPHISPQKFPQHSPGAFADDCAQLKLSLALSHNTM